MDSQTLQRSPAPLHGAASKPVDFQRARTLDADGKSGKDGRIVLLSIGRSITTMEYSRFKQVADADPDESPQVVIVDGAASRTSSICVRNK